MLINAINSICIRKYNNYNIYAHNFSNFDGVLLLRILNKFKNGKIYLRSCLAMLPIIKDGRIISIYF